MWAAGGVVAVSAESKNMGGTRGSDVVSSADNILEVCV